jgi:hypothetical protein
VRHQGDLACGLVVRPGFVHKEIRTNSIETADWSAGDTALFVMRTTVIFEFAARERVRGDKEHYALHRLPAQGKWVEERGGTTAGMEVPRIRLYGRSRRQAHHRAKDPGTVQATNPRNHAQGQGCQHRDDNQRTGLDMRCSIGYFGFCETPEVHLTRWVRLRLRAALWWQPKTPRRRRAALIALGVKGRLASNTAGSGLGRWHLAKSKALSGGLSNKYFSSLGLSSLFGTCWRSFSNHHLMPGGVGGRRREAPPIPISFDPTRH